MGDRLCQYNVPPFDLEQHRIDLEMSASGGDYRRLKRYIWKPLQMPDKQYSVLPPYN